MNWITIPANVDGTVDKETGQATSSRLASFDQKRAQLAPGTVLVWEWDRRSQRVIWLTVNLRQNPVDQSIDLVA